jgi:hypothetical protein
MSKIFTNTFKVRVIDSIVAYNPSFYMFLGKPLPFVDDTLPPTPQDSVDETFLSGYDSMIAAKSIALDEVSYMIPRHDWVANTGYVAYRETNGKLFGNNFYVSVSSGSGYDVFKCLSNNGVLSTVAPNAVATSPSDDIYETSDGYQWKYMYTVDNAAVDKFATRDFLPVVPNMDVSGNAVSGSIDYISVEYGGSNYDAYTSGTIQSTAVSGNSLVYTIESSASSNANFYVGSAIKITSGTGAGQQQTITGYSVSGSTRNVVIDAPFETQPSTTSTYEITPNVIVVGGGQSFIGRALVNAAASNSIYKVEINDRGIGYRYGSAIVTGNTGGTTNTAILNVVISPKGGHGYDPIRELGAKYLCLTTTFDTTDVEASGKLLDTNEFRSIGVLVDPSFANVQLTYTSSTGNFAVGETITQSNTGATGILVGRTSTTLTLTDVVGPFFNSNGLSNYITGDVSSVTAAVTAVRNNGSDPLAGEIVYANATTKLNISSLAGSFAADDVVSFTGNTSTSNATVYFANTSQVWLVNVKGTIGDTLYGATAVSSATIDTVIPSDIIPGTGDIVYLENISPINKAPGQTETIKAIIEF